MAVAAWLVTREANRTPARATVGQQALVAWGVQLALNVAWSAVFFGQRRIGAAVAVIVALWTAIAVCVERAARVSRRAALLLLPYLAWTSFVLSPACAWSSWPEEATIQAGRDSFG